MPDSEVGGVIKHLHHEVLPIDIDPAPYIGEAGGQEVEKVCFRQVETKQMQNANDQVKLSGNPEVKGKIGDQIADQPECIGYICRRHHDVIINVTIQDEVDDPSQHPLQSFLINLVLIVVVIRSAKRTVIYHRKEGKDDVRQ